ncbi:hypothetical protein HNY73_011650 [Argiope bruennichi]|uniref:Uncharacterized protein n=1 Tax=Argiope bruennichi TaxID=94029 RepID=A0A8T0EZY0_ARGBR|nr:hypothetical protein HNY73_011650 [Argiope bruennichi]
MALEYLKTIRFVAHAHTFRFNDGINLPVEIGIARVLADGVDESERETLLVTIDHSYNHMTPKDMRADCGRRAAGSEGRRGPKILRIYRRPEGRRHQDSGGGGLSSRQRIGQARRPDRAAASSPSQTVAMQPNHCSPVCEVHRRETTLCVVPGELPSRRLCGMERRLRVGRGMDPSHPCRQPEPKQEPETIYIDLKQCKTLDKIEILKGNVKFVFEF